MRLYFLEVTGDKGRKHLVMDGSGSVIQSLSKRVIEEQLKNIKQLDSDINVKIAFEDVETK